MTEIIAEVGINHNGAFDSAVQHCEAAALSGANFVKLHLAYARNMVNVQEKRVAWSDRHDAEIDPIDKFVERMELSIADYLELKRLIESHGSQLMLSVYDQEAAEDALSMGVSHIKLASCDFTKEGLIRFLTPRVERLYLATGMVSEDELDAARNYIDPHRTTVMHCISRYPTPYGELNLSYIDTLRKFGWTVGYSDHTRGIGASALSLSFRPAIIEKHFMLSDSHQCPDQAVSCAPREMQELCLLAKNLDNVLGNGERVMSEEELSNRDKFRNRWL